MVKNPMMWMEGSTDTRRFGDISIKGTVKEAERKRWLVQPRRRWVSAKMHVIANYAKLSSRINCVGSSETSGYSFRGI